MGFKPHAIGGQRKCIEACQTASACQYCFHRIGQSSQRVLLDSLKIVANDGEMNGDEGLLLPSTPGTYLACYYESAASFRDDLPMVCSEAFTVIEEMVDACGDCGAADGLRCLGCDGVPFSGALLDACGACQVPFPLCLLRTPLLVKLILMSVIFLVARATILAALTARARRMGLKFWIPAGCAVATGRRAPRFFFSLLERVCGCGGALLTDMVTRGPANTSR